MTATVDKSDGEGFGAIIDAAIAEDSLGNIDVLRDLVAQTFSEWGEFQSTIPDLRAIDDWLDVVCGYLAEVLLGAHPQAYKPLPPWNHPDEGGVAHFINTQIRIEGDTPKEIMNNYMLTRLTLLTNLVNEANKKGDPSGLGKAFNALVSQTAYHLLGIDDSAK
jgi:hypothetical protein